MPRHLALSRLAFPSAGLLLTLACATGCTGDTTTALGATERCDNDVDDDGDLLVDCADPDCAGHLACDPQYVELQCDNHVDDDGDLLVDCDDPDCSNQQACNPFEELICNDGVDNDADGLTDCRDPDCAQAGNCQEHCSDGVDNDGDGLVDCQDPDCYASTECLHEICGNGMDDDGDLLVDCDDPDCSVEPQCATSPPLEHCANGVDDDGDLLVDCDDPDCDTNPLCVEIFCNDGLDNNGRRGVDCEDSDCQNSPACQLNPTCQGAAPIQCGDTLLGTTRGRRNSFTEYACLSEGSFPGGERFYVYSNTSPEAQILYVSLQAFSPGTTFVLVVLTGTTSGCTAATCLTASNTGTDSYSITVPHAQTAYLVVDSVEPDGGRFKLTANCTPTNVEICGNNLDDDFDYRTDCMDTDCIGYYACNYWISAGIRCELGDPNEVCAPGERCLPLQVGGMTTSGGICTRECTSQGSPTTGCENPTYTTGACVPFVGQGDHCVMQCGTVFGTPGQCPPTTLCTDPANGSTVNVYDGICAPYY